MPLFSFQRSKGRCLTAYYLNREKITLYFLIQFVSTAFIVFHIFFGRRHRHRSSIEADYYLFPLLLSSAFLRPALFFLPACLGALWKREAFYSRTPGLSSIICEEKYDESAFCRHATSFHHFAVPRLKSPHQKRRYAGRLHSPRPARSTVWPHHRMGPVRPTETI